MRNATAILHVGPAAGARFTQYTAILQADGEIAPAATQRFLYVLEGEIEVGGESLRPVEKPYLPIDGLAAPGPFRGDEPSIQPQPLEGDEALRVRALLPADPAFDFAVNTMTYEPGASLPAVEIHVMEHGLLMLDGGGIYRLGDSWYPVTRGDFIWMAPYCPQWFGALGKTPARYLIYKDWNR
jgi:(S)-ureidoglycine aminohydrolase